MGKITTKTGDDGETSLFGGRRVSKASFWMEILGELDELQCRIGWAGCGMMGDYKKLLLKLQKDIYSLMSIVGFEFKIPKNLEFDVEEELKFLEDEIDRRQAVVIDLNKFILPASTEMAARLHLARTSCRKVERVLVRNLLGILMEASSSDAVAGLDSGASGARKAAKKITDTDSGTYQGTSLAKEFLKYLNRLSDLLFILAYEFEER